MTRRGVVVATLSLFAVGCGSDGSDAPSAPEPPPEIVPGEMGVLAGSGVKGSDAIDANEDGEPDVLPALEANFDYPLDVTPTADGLLLIDWNGHKLRRLRGDAIEFVTGTGVEGDACRGDFNDEGCEALSAELNHPTDVTLDPDGRIAIAAWHNSKIKRYDPATDRVVDVCGTGGRDFEGDGGPCRDDSGEDLVTFDLPSGVVYDADGGLLISDQANQVVRRLAPSGVVTVVAGQCPGSSGFGCGEGRGYDGDGGPATLAHLSNSIGQGTDPQGKIAMDPAGNLYIADTGNHAIRRVVPGSDGILGEGDPAEEIITTVAGSGVRGREGDGGPAIEATLTSPTDVAVGPDGSLYIADRGNSCVRRVDPDGIISTFAGTCGEEGPAELVIGVTDALLSQPYGVAVDAAGTHLYIADTLNHCVRQVLLDE